jgi:hypothetical protein
MVGSLPDDLGADDLAPAPRLSGITIECQQMALLVSADGYLAIERQIVLACPVGPVVPGAEGVIDNRIAVDRVLRASSEHDEPLSGIKKSLEVFIGCRRFAGYIEARGKESIGDRDNCFVKAWIKRYHGTAPVVEEPFTS